jgi:hypothetical protein
MIVLPFFESVTMHVEILRVENYGQQDQ